jgi:DNA-binding transcriptional regulator/RsmH inhibitor MraZ
VSAADKQRFTLPVDLRRRVKAGSGDHNVLFINLTPELTCLTGFGEDHLNNMRGEIEAEVIAARARGESLDRHRKAVEAVASVERITFDDGGRFSLPDEIRELMGVEDSLWFVGAIWTFEIWAPQRYLDSGQGTPLSQVRCRKAMEDWAANPKNPKRAA